MVSVLIATYNSAPFLEACLASIRRQTHGSVEIIIVDNASTDGTRKILEEWGERAKIVFNENNIGFSRAQNQGIRAAAGNWLLALNPDVVLSPGFIAEMVGAGNLDSKVGSVSGKLLRWHPSTEPEFSRVIDSTGIYFTPSLRHLDRGAEQTDRGQFDALEYVFGASGAAALYRRKMVEDISVEGEFFDEQFFAYREDADLAWRAQLMGWKCLYVPSAVAWHVRRVTPERREQLPNEINWHSVKNRFLMRGKNASGWLCWRLFWPVGWRDLMIFGYAVVRDRRLLSAFVYPLRNFRRVQHKRRIIQLRRRVTDRRLIWWFSDTPRARFADVETSAIPAGMSSAPLEDLP